MLVLADTHIQAQASTYTHEFRYTMHLSSLEGTTKQAQACQSESCTSASDDGLMGRYVHSSWRLKRLTYFSYTSYTSTVVDMMSIVPLAHSSTELQYLNATDGNLWQ